MIENILMDRYGEFLDALDIYENFSSLILSKIVIKKDVRNSGIGTKILEDLVKYADTNKQIIALTPSNDFGGSKNRLTQFYKRFGFKLNKGHHKSFQFMQSMIRYPKLNENMKPIIKNLLRENFENLNEFEAPNDCDCCKYFDYSSLKNIYGGLQHPLYYMINKGTLYKINYISPKAYLKTVAKNFKVDYDYMINSNVISNDNVDKYVQNMKDGDKFPIIFYTIGNSSQEGRHRALACLKLKCKSIPVVSIKKINYKDLPKMLMKFKGLTFEEIDSIFKNDGYDGITDLDYKEITRFFERIDENVKVTKKLINEELFNRHSKEQVELMNEFINFACNSLDLPKSKVILQFSHNGLVTTAAYGDKQVRVYAKERATVDIMRSIAHELTHMKQDLEGRLDPANHNANNEAGSPIENEANYKAGEIIRKFGEKYPKIYI